MASAQVMGLVLARRRHCGVAARRSRLAIASEDSGVENLDAVPPLSLDELATMAAVVAEQIKA